MTETIRERHIVDWDDAQGLVTDCETQSGGTPGIWIDPESNSVHVQGREISTAGSVPLSVKLSPSGRVAAVLSAEGPRAISLIPFLGQGGATGQHYHQIVSLPAGALIDLVVQLPLTSEDAALTACWDPEEGFVIYTDVLFFHAVVVEVQKS